MSKNLIISVTNFESHRGPNNTDQKWQWLPLLDVRIFAPKFSFLNFSLLTKIVGNENFNLKQHNSHSKAGI